MAKTMTATTRRRLNVQGMSDISDETLVEVFPWQRMADCNGRVISVWRPGHGLYSGCCTHVCWVVGRHD